MTKLLVQYKITKLHFVRKNTAKKSSITTSNKGQSAETQEKIQRIIDTGEYCSVGNINVVGHTDSSGAASYNLGLSKRRASEVRGELVRQGVNSALITSEGMGETQLFIDTGDGVKEQLNRRVEGSYPFERNWRY